MRQNGRWRLTDFQRLLVVILAAVATFLTFMALGLGSLTLLIIALSLLVLIGLGVFALGLRYSGRGPVEGQARVLAVPPPPAGKIVSKCELRLEVELPGRPAQVMRHRDPSVSLTKWPRVGALLPIEVDQRAKSLRVRWDRVLPNQAEPASVPVRAEPVAVPAQAAKPAVPFFTDYAEGALDADRRGGPAPADPSAPGTGDEPRRPRAAIEAAGRPGATITPEESARAAEFELPMRSPGTQQPGYLQPGIPQPRPAEPGSANPSSSSSSSSSSDPEPTLAFGRPDPDEGAMGAMLVVSDLDRSVRFYRDLVGLRVIDQAANTAVLSFGVGRVVLRQLADMSPVDRRVSHLHIKVADVDSAHRAMVNKGVRFVHEPRVISVGERLDLWAATFRDPDGHDIALTQWRDR